MRGKNVGEWVGGRLSKFFGRDAVVAEIPETNEETEAINSRFLSAIDGFGEKVKERNMRMAIMRDRIELAVALLSKVADEVEDKPEDYRRLPDPARIRALIVLLVGAACLSPEEVSKAIEDGGARWRDG